VDQEKRSRELTDLGGRDDCSIRK
jgi:hypothetical protein